MSKRIHEERLVALLQCLLSKEALRSEVSVPRASRRIDLLLHIGPAMIQSTRRAIEDAIMQGHVNVSPAERRSLVDQVLEQGARQGARQSLLRLAAALVGPQDLSALRRIEDLDALEARLEDLLRR